MIITKGLIMKHLIKLAVVISIFFLGFLLGTENQKMLRVDRAIEADAIRAINESVHTALLVGLDTATNDSEKVICMADKRTVCYSEKSVDSLVSSLTDSFLDKADQDRDLVKSRGNLPFFDFLKLLGI